MKGHRKNERQNTKRILATSGRSDCSHPCRCDYVYDRAWTVHSIEGDSGIWASPVPFPVITAVQLAIGRKRNDKTRRRILPIKTTASIRQKGTYLCNSRMADATHSYHLHFRHKG